MKKYLRDFSCFDYSYSTKRLSYFGSYFSASVKRTGIMAFLFALHCSAGFGQTLYDSFADGDFTSGPVWGGNTALWTVVANSDAAAGATGSNTVRLNSSGGSTDYLSSQIATWGTSQEWGFWVGRRGQAYTAQNKTYLWLYANESTLNNLTVDGYRVTIGDDGGDDEIRLEYIVNGAVSATVITSSGSVPNGITDIGFLVRVTRSSLGNWQLFTSTLPTLSGTGAIATDIPNSSNATVNQGIATNNSLVPATNGYTGFAALHSTAASAIISNEIDQVYFTSNTSPLVSISGGDTLTCATTSITVTAVATGDPVLSYAWSGGAAGASPEDRVLTLPNTYTVTVTDGNGFTATASVVITADTSAPAITLTGLNSAYCIDEGPFIYFTYSPVGGTFSGSGASYIIDNEDGSANFTLVTPGTYSLTYTYTDPENGCVGSYTQSVTVNALPAVDILDLDTAYCASNIPVLVHGSPNFAADSVFGGFSGSATFSDLSDGTSELDISTPGSYTLTYSYSDMNGCVNSVTMPFEVYGLPATVTVTGGGTYCDSTTISASNGNSGTIYFQGAVSGGTSTATPATSSLITASGTYYFRALSVNGCWGEEGSAAVVINACGCTNPPTVDAGADTVVVCHGSEIGLTAITGGGATEVVSWTGGTGTYDYPLFPDLSQLNYTNAPSEAGDTLYLVVTTDAPVSCNAATDTVVIIVNTLPTAVFSGSTTICTGDSADLTISFTGNPPFTFSYDDGSNTYGPFVTALSSVIVTVNPSSTTVYNITDISDNLCVGINGSSAQVIVNPCGCPNPVVVSAGPDIHVCISGDVTLTGSIGGSASSAHWTGGAGSFNPGPDSLTTTYTPDLSEAGSIVTLYLVTDDPAGACEADSDAINIYVDSLFYIDAGPDIQVCINGAVGLSGLISGGATTGHWSGGNGTFDPGRDSLVTTYFPAPGESGTTITLYLVPDQGDNVCPPDSNGIDITVNALPIVDAGADTSVCEGGFVTLSGSVTGGASGGEWHGGLGAFNPDRYTLNATYSPDVSEAGTTVQLYLVSVNLASVCLADSDLVEIAIDSLPVVNAGPDIHVCESGDVTLSGYVGGGASTGHWTGGLGTFDPSRDSLVTTYTPHPSEAGTIVTIYLVTDATAPCLTDSDAISITVDQLAVVDAGPDIDACITGDVNLTGTIGGGAVSAYWSGGAGIFNPSRDSLSTTYTPDLSESQSTVTLYLVANLSNTNVCPLDSNDILIHVDTVPSAFAGADQNLCYGDQALLSGYVTGGVTTGTWFTSGDGTFDDSTSLTATYTPGMLDLSTGTVTLLLVPDPEGVCPVLPDDVILIINPELILSTSKTDVLCYGESTGTINLTVTGGTAPYTYLWSNAASTEDIGSLAIGTYTVTITDQAGCTVTTSATITQPAAGLSASTTQVNVLCFGNATGSIDLTVTGGTVPYTYNWSNSSTTEDISGLAAGTYTVTVTDQNGCTTSTSATITQPAAGLSASTTQVNVLCFGNATGSIDLTVTGGTVPYTYNWSNTATTEDISGLAAGTYTVTVTDQNGCTTSTSATITQPAAGLLASTTQVNVLCFGNATGSIDLTVTGGTVPYTYNWSNSATTEDISNLAAGTYTVTVTDQNGCTTSTSATITQPAAGLSASTTQINVLCFGNATGSIDLTVTGGTVPYTYNWSNSTTTEDIGGLAAGTYTVTVTDQNGCTTSTSATITQPAAGLSASTTQVNVLCFGNATGSIDLTVTGGTVPYTYNWSSSATTEDISALAAGTYTVTVTDQNGCTTSTSATITQPAAGLSASTTQVNVLCFGNATGSIDLTVTGGTVPYTYNWSNSSTTEDISGLAAGTYTVTVTDQNGCTTSTSATITQPASGLSASTTQINVLCFGNATGSIDLTVTGGTVPYTYNWSNSATTEDISNLAAETYTVTVTDQNGCTTSTSATITQPAAGLSASTTQINVLCFGNATGSIDLTVTGGTVPYTYNWSNSSTTEDISGLAAGTYTVTVTDQNGCTTSTSATITQPSAGLSPSTTQINVLCFGNATGSIDLTVTGGTVPYTYNWSNSATTQDISGLTAGTYTVTVTDQNGCTTSTSATITQPAPLVVNAGSDVTICSGGSTTLTASGASTYTWMPGSLSGAVQNVSPAATTTYTVTGTDLNGCTATATVIVTVNTCAATVNLKFYIEGYYIGGGMMNQVLYFQGVDPNPLSTHVDTVTIELHDTTNASLIIDTYTGVLQTDGTLMCTFTNATIGDAYWIAIKHRSAVQTWSKFPVVLTAVTNYNFSTAANKAYGDNMKDAYSENIWSLYNGDINQDESVDIFDSPQLDTDIQNFVFGYYNTDLNGDGSTDIFDSPMLDTNIQLFVSSYHPF